MTSRRDLLKIGPMVNQVVMERFRLPKALLERRVPVVLASFSPRRRHLFRALGLPFKSQGAQIDETRLTGELPEALAARLAFEKAQSVAREHPGAWVVGADTIVVGMGRVLGKPRGEAQAAAMLELLAGRTHRVLSGVALVHAEGGGRTGFVECTRVTFRHLGRAEMEAYIRTGHPLDKAGAYGIQGPAGRFVSRIEGSYTNVVGLPMERLRALLLGELGGMRRTGPGRGENGLAAPGQTVIASESAVYRCAEELY